MKTQSNTQNLPITTNRYKNALELAHRLNRIFANEYACYRYAVKHNTTQNRLDKQKKAQADLAKQIADKDRRNKVIDALYDLANYTYINKTTGIVSTQPKYTIKRAVKEALSLKKPTVVCDTTPQQPKPILTQELLQHHLYYDQELGTFEWNEGSLAGTIVKFTATLAKPMKPQNPYTLPIKPRNHRPSHAGYSVVSMETYLTEVERAKSSKIGAIGAKNARFAYARQYLIRNPDKTSALATIKVTYYVLSHKESQQYPSITLKVGTVRRKYPAQHLAYLYMGAGGDWNYNTGQPNGLDNAYRVNTTTAPQGLRLYCHKTNKPKRMPCRDGNALNLKWENIKPDEISTATITKDPTIEKPPRILTCKRVYSYKRNIKVIKGHWVVHNIGSDAFYAWSLDDAEREFNRRLARVKGTKQKLRNGDVLVTK